ncbi:ABC transporter permease subunit [Cohnella sp. CFH 77786]|uniref:carbohydrate ABC transporter permease n=1 Tax=Cohnella sp. CFH 77786 TaxID=2662265 RepID=UPI001C608DC4|nr:carbohydrate ABC transporter permease [Cohnella sp. CFH 77786]MBW5449229.1 ABC transporter permease subunit [Cohnella sp. CFH 77786]
MLRIIHFLGMTIIAVVCLLPIIWMILGSMRSYQELIQNAGHLSLNTLVPVEWTLKNFTDVIFDDQHPFLRYVFNTLFVAATVTLLVLLINSLAAFAFAKLSFRGSAAIFVLFMSALIIPGEVMLVPNYMLVNNLGWLNSFKALIIPSTLSVFGIFMLKQFFEEIPTEILESARLDGASWLQIYRAIVLPASVPALITLGIITFLGNWDGYLWPLVVINDDKLQLIQVAIANFTSISGTEWTKVLAANTIATVPILILFLILQRYYVQGITMSGVKG